MTIEWILLFAFLALIAEILGTIGGFGSSLFFVPIAGFFLDFYSVLGITAIFHIISNLTKIGFFRNGIDKKIILSIGIPSVIFVILGAFLSRFFDSGKLEMALSFFLIFLSLLFLIQRNLRVKANSFNSISGGAVSGFLAGLVGTGGSVRGILLSAYRLPKEIFIATSAVIDLAVDSSRAVVYTLQGYVHTHDLYLIPVLFVSSVVGTYTGKYLLKYIDENKFRSIVLLLILMTGIITLWKIYTR